MPSWLLTQNATLTTEQRWFPPFVEPAGWGPHPAPLPETAAPATLGLCQTLTPSSGRGAHSEEAHPEVSVSLPLVFLLWKVHLSGKKPTAPPVGAISSSVRAEQRLPRNRRHRFPCKRLSCGPPSIAVSPSYPRSARVCRGSSYGWEAFSSLKQTPHTHTHTPRTHTHSPHPRHAHTHHTHTLHPRHAHTNITQTHILHSPDSIAHTHTSHPRHTDISRTHTHTSHTHPARTQIHQPLSEVSGVWMVGVVVLVCTIFSFPVN